MTDAEADRNDAAGITRRLFVAIATSEYEGGWRKLAGVNDEVVEFRNWLCMERLEDRRFTPEHVNLATNPSLAEIETALRRSPVTGWKESDAVALLVAGHGEKSAEADEHYLILKDTHPAALAATALSTSELLKWLLATRLENLFLVIDACYAGLIEEQIITRSRRLPPGWVILPSAQKDEPAELGALTKAVSSFLRVLKTDGGAKFTRGPYLRVDEFVRFINEELGLAQQVRPISRGAFDRQHICLPNPHYDRREFAVPRRDVERHWNLRGRGLAHADESGWLFTERPALMRALLSWLAGPARSIVLTGAAGAGKSAALGRLVTLSDPEFGREFAADVGTGVDELRPPDQAVDVAVYAKGKISTEVLTQIVRACHVPTPKQDPIENSIERGLDHWHEWLLRRDEPVTIVLDGLDEAAAPTDLLSLLMRLDPDPGVRRVRLIVGVRSTGGTNEWPTTEPDRMPLAELAVAQLDAEVLRVDREPLWDDADIHRYIRRILRDAEDSPYRGGDIAELTSAIAQWSSHSFLLAHEAARWVTRQERRLTGAELPTHTDLSQQLIGIVRANLNDAFEGNADARHRAVALLRTIAFGRGGVPWFRVWPELTTALDGEESGRVYGDRDILDLLRSGVEGYLVTDDQSDAPAFRLFHDELRVALRTNWQQLSAAEEPDASAPATSSPRRDELSAAEATIARTLLRLAEPALDARSRRAIDPYIRRHLVEHAAAAGRLDSTLIPAEFLPYADPWRLRAAAAGMSGVSARRSLPLLAVVRRVTHLWDRNSPARNAAAMQMWAALDGIRNTPIGPSPWEVLWAVSRADNGFILGRAPSDIWAVTTTSLPSQGAVAITGSTSVPTIWNLAADTGGVPMRGPGHQGAINVLATIRLRDGREVVVTGGDDASIRMWDLTTRLPIGGPLDGHTGKIRALATAVLTDGTVVAVTGGEDNSVRLWDLENGVSLGDPLHGHDGPVTAVVTAWVPERGPIAITGSVDRTVRIWDLTTRSAVGDPLRGHTGTVAAIIVADSPTGMFAVSGVRDAEARVKDRTLRRWDLEPSAAHTVLTVLPAGTLSMTMTTFPDGRAVVATGHEDATVRLTDAQTGAAIGAPLRGHSGTVPAIAVAQLSTGPTIVSGGNDSTLRTWALDDLPTPRPDEQLVDTVEAILAVDMPGQGAFAAITTTNNVIELWDIHTGQPTGKRFAGAAASVQGMAIGRLRNNMAVLAAGTWDAAVLMWSLETGELLHPPMRGHRGPIHSLHFASMPNGDVTLVTGGWDAVRRWDAETGQQDSPLLDQKQSALAILTPHNEHPTALIGDLDGILTVLDVASGRPAPVSMPTIPGGITGLVPITTGGLSMIAVSDSAGGVHIVDAGSGAAVRPRIDGHAGGVTAMATAMVGGSRPALITAGPEPMIRCWEVLSPEPLGVPLDLPHPVRAMAVHPGEQPLLLIAGNGVSTARMLHLPQ